MLEIIFFTDLFHKSFVLRRYLQDYGPCIILYIRLVKHLCGFNGKFCNVLII